jgi:hypothetical protein
VHLSLPNHSQFISEKVSTYNKTFLNWEESKNGKGRVQTVFFFCHLSQLCKLLTSCSHTDLSERDESLDMWNHMLSLLGL